MLIGIIKILLLAGLLDFLAIHSSPLVANAVYHNPFIMMDGKSEQQDKLKPEEMLAASMVSPKTNGGQTFRKGNLKAQ
jgi:hypothetical protein